MGIFHFRPKTMGYASIRRNSGGVVKIGDFRRSRYKYGINWFQGWGLELPPGKMDEVKLLYLIPSGFNSCYYVTEPYCRERATRGFNEARPLLPATSVWEW